MIAHIITADHVRHAIRWHYRPSSGFCVAALSAATYLGGRSAVIFRDPAQ